MTDSELDKTRAKSEQNESSFTDDIIKALLLGSLCAIGSPFLFWVFSRGASYALMYTKIGVLGCGLIGAIAGYTHDQSALKDLLKDKNIEIACENGKINTIKMQEENGEFWMRQRQNEEFRRTIARYR